MAWYKTEGGTEDFKPPIIDKDSSKKVVYVRKDFNLEERNIEDNVYKIWTYMEQKIPKEDWELYSTIMQNSTDIEDLTNAVIELAGIIGG